MSITALKLVTGEDILCQIEIDSDDTLTIKNPVQVISVPQNGQAAFGFAPFPLCSPMGNSSKFQIKKAHVVLEYEPAEEFAKNYAQTFGTIFTPTKKLILQ